MPSPVQKIWSAVPASIKSLVAATVDRVQGVEWDLPHVSDSSAKRRLFVGPVNHTGQGYRWARAAQRSGELASTVFVRGGSNLLSYEFDYTVPWRTAEYSQKWQRGMLEHLRSHYTHVLVEACAPPLGGMFGGDTERQIAALIDSGLKVALVWHGVDVRLPSRHMLNEPASYFHQMDAAARQAYEAEAQKNARLSSRFNIPVFVSTAGLLLDVPKASLLGITIEAARWANQAPVLASPKPVVLHAPSNAAVKGTSSIKPIMEKLHRDGIITHRELQRIPNAEMPQALAGADIVLDQFAIGDYGAAASESMASGRLCVSHVSDSVRQQIAALAGMDLPIVEATSETIENVIREVAASPERFRTLASAGPAFVSALHDGAFSARVLWEEFLKD